MQSSAGTPEGEVPGVALRQIHPAPSLRLVGPVDCIASFLSSVHPDAGSWNKLPGEKDPSLSGRSLAPKGLKGGVSLS